MSDYASLYASSQSEDSDPVPIPEEPVESKEARSLQRLWSMIDIYAPHLRPSFVYSSAWWKIHKDAPEAHMFKYLLFKGLEDISVIFNDVKAERPGRVRKLLEEANDKAAPVWNDHRIPFLERQARCKAILDPVIELNAASEFRFSAFPKSTVAELDKLFKQFYSEPAKVLLIGRTCKHAYEVQDRYATAVASLLGTVSRAYESRAAVCLRKVYGRNSIPLLSISSVSGLWELCKIPLYRAISSLLYKWIQPFAEVSETHPFGCDYVSSIHRFLRPKSEKRNTFYLSVLIWSADLLVVMMLDEYVAPKPMVAGYVRRQLLCNGEESRIQAAILDAQGGQSTTELYSTWLSYSGLDLTDAESPVIDAVVSNRLLLHTLFDLMLGERVKAFILNGYTEIHDVRASIQSFLTAWVDFMEPAADPRSPWWDGIERLLNPSRYWLSIRLRHHSDFSSVFRSWLDDSSHLQTWLARFEEETLLVNNPKDADRVFSESNAMEVMDWAKFQGSFLDQKRRASFRNNPGWFLEECEELGLFTTRTPRFSQLFFYDFTDREVEIGMRQVSPSRRAAQAYLSSGFRMESSCGISEVWYRYVESHQTLFTDEDEMTPFTPLQQTPQGTPPGLELHGYQVDFLSGVFEWEKQHRRPRPRRKVTASIQSTGDYADQDSQHGGSIEEITSASPAIPSQPEDVSEYTEDETGRGLARRDGGHAIQVEEERAEEAGGPVSGTAEGEGGDELDDWPTTASFYEDLSKIMGDAEKIPEVPYVVTDTFVPSSIPEERELRLDPALTGLTYSLTGVAFGVQVDSLAEAPEHEAEVVGEEDPVEGLEASQSAQVQAGSDVEAVSDPGIVIIEGSDDVDMQDAPYVADAYTMAAQQPTRSQKRKALDSLIESRRIKYGPKA